MADNTPESNEPPKIPSFKPTRKKDEERAGAGPLSDLGKSGKPSTGAGNPLSGLGKPSAVSTQGSDIGKGTGGGFNFPGFGGKKGVPGMKIRGMGGAGSSLLDRLKNLRRKDLMFIAAGLGTLMMAPLAEHFMMTPEENVGTLEEGFDSKGPLFPDGSTVYEHGTGGFSPGGLVGQGTDVITPLNVRDPSALVMGPGAKQKQEAVVEPPATTTPRDDDSSASKWKDALAESAKSGVKEAVKRTPKLPTPNVKMQGALRGLSALSGGGGKGGSFTLPALSASNVPNRAAGSNSLTRSQAVPGFQGATRRSGAAGSGLEALKGAAGRQADIFSKAGSASDGLQTAANVALPFPGGGGSGWGGPGGDGDPGKNPGGNQIKENKQLGESLEFLRRKMEQEKMIGLKWKKKEWNQFGRQKAIEEGAIKLAFDSFGKIVVDPIAGVFKTLAEQRMEPSGAAATGIQCVYPSAGPVRYTNSAEAKYFCANKTSARCQGKGCKFTTESCENGCFSLPGSSNGNGNENNNNVDNAPDRIGNVDKPGDASGLPLSEICAKLTAAKSLTNPDVNAVVTEMGEAAKAAADADASLNGKAVPLCGATKSFAPNTADETRTRLDQVVGTHLKNANDKLTLASTGMLPGVKVEVDKVLKMVDGANTDQVIGGFGKYATLKQAELATLSQWKYATQDVDNAVKAILAREGDLTAAMKAVATAEANFLEVQKALGSVKGKLDAGGTELGKAETALAAWKNAPPSGLQAASVAELTAIATDLRTKHGEFVTATNKEIGRAGLIGGAQTPAAGGQQAVNAIAASKQMIVDTAGALDAAYAAIGPVDGKTQPGPQRQTGTSPETANAATDSSITGTVDAIPVPTTQATTFATAYLLSVEEKSKTLTGNFVVPDPAAPPQNAPPIPAPPTEPGTQHPLRQKMYVLAEKDSSAQGLKDASTPHSTALTAPANAGYGKSYQAAMTDAQQSKTQLQAAGIQ
ncbi:MAG: hypothetical protein CO113_17115 [Elusimicrobia bacterium CG_4_9_14_3_um_filter_62_55]|nr:MAG: hypothetical protein COX66_17880 [Elusimicrobia bacterium CG_4_10_14_0_2_um_filter_63_34]PJB23669.1 MAG: hypothetical protein CO113_17115 [Elusimicrobia bacterium CG_4_9_14_3_um_filter_62_55]